MKSGLEGRNNCIFAPIGRRPDGVSMKSGLEGRNNLSESHTAPSMTSLVSMKSGLEGRNNQTPSG